MVKMAKCCLVALSAIGVACSSGTDERAKKQQGSAAVSKEAMAQVRAFAQRIGDVWLRDRACPDMRGTADPWGRPYRAICEAQLLRLVSDGPDGTFGTEDDPVATIRAPAAGSSAEPGRAPPPPPDLVEVTAKQLFADYQENEVAADLKYKGKLLRVNGKVTRISKDLLDEPLVEIATSNEYMPVYASFADKVAVARLKRGQQVTARCRGNGASLNHALLADCVLE